MNAAQQEATARLQSAPLRARNLKEALPIRGEAYGYIFTEVAGVTVLIGRRGDFKVPAVRTYPDDVEAAVNAPELWRKQKERDDTNPTRARLYKTGHLRPIVDTHLKCSDVRCPCAYEGHAALEERSLG